MQAADNKPGVSVLIPTWNGAALLRQYLPPLQVAMDRYEGPWECVIVDDGSTDETLQLLAKEFAWVRVVPLPDNGGVSRAFNAGLRETRFPYVLSINNDVKVSPDFLAPLVQVLEKFPEAFGAGSLQKGKSLQGESLLEGYTEIGLRDGIIFLNNRTGETVGRATFESGCLNLACALLRRDMLLQLGGMNEIFSPFYWEDVELCIRARKAGWSLYFCPESVVDHCHSTTTRKKPLMLRLIPVRNYHLIHWLLLDSADLQQWHRSNMLRRIWRELLAGKPGMLIGLILAGLKLPAVKRSLAQNQSLRKKTLKEIWDIKLQSK